MSTDPRTVPPQTYPPQQAPPAAQSPAEAATDAAQLALPRLRVKGTLATAAVAVMVAQIANALPGSLNGEFQTTFNAVGSQLTLIAAAFMIPVVVFELTFGLLGDKLGHKKLVMGGSLLMAIGSLVCTLAPTVEAMWIGSALNGLGAGAIFPASLALVAAVTHDARARARGIAMWAGFLSVGAALSPLLGGTLASLGSWRGAYGTVAVLSVLTVILALLVAAEHKAAQGRKPDWWGQITFALGLILVLFGLVKGPEDGWGGSHVIFPFVAGIALMLAFVLIETRVESPLLDLRLFRNRGFTISSIVAVVGMFAFLGSLFSLSMWLGPVQHQNPMNIGLLFILLQGPTFVLVPLISRLLTRVAGRWMLTAGFLLMAAGALMASGLDVTNMSMTPFITPALLLGVGFALTLSPMTAIALNTVPLHLAGMASATTNLLRDLGFALGPVLAGAVALSTAGATLGASLQTATLPVDQAGPATAIFQAGGPIALNSLPPGAPGSAAHELALQSLGNGFSDAFIVCAIAAAAAALLTLIGLHGVRDTHPASEAFVDPLVESAQS
ncbi:drug resistance transporter, EmrB/QacA subfamily [Arthrobacter sp. ok909]|uniref:MFS transporter n=1 Tax=Arthrobacter sp. ok909 TaxID=1761746 RepID=UPI0008847E62|nr:MFS transporter [Arthrobacter sp. ok909]SDO94033.1 drug resistance transporter, EmrB/QacA subfamily [Arthrobacter sp. ok909]